MLKYMVFILTGTLLLQLQVATANVAERYYQNKWCRNRNGIVERRYLDGTRADCVFEDKEKGQKYAIEFDFPKKWAESVGQSLYYAVMERKKSGTYVRPGIVLIIKNQGEYRYVRRLVVVSFITGIRLWIIEDIYNE
ncbi:MAG: hypothetical protein GY861_22490 [bacterium]|nr:hypothetical protein [bacterium]